MQSSQRPQYNRSVVALLVVVFCNAGATLIGITALGKQVYDITHRELDLGLLGLAEFAPAALLVLVTGSVADRYERTRVASLSSALEAVAGVGLALYAATDPSSVLPIFAMVLVFGLGRAFHAPANRALPADIVTPLQLPWLTSRRAATWQAATIVGPVIGGFLYAVDPVAPYIAMAAFAAFAAAAMFFVKVERETHVEEPSTRGRLHQALEGLRYIRRSPILLGAISLDLFAVLFGGAVALLPAIATDRLDVGAVGLGWLRAAGGIGAALTTVALTRWAVTRHVGRALFVSVAVFGAATIALGLTTEFVIAFIAMAVLNGADSVSVFIRSTLVPLATPRSKRGRVLAVESVFIGASNELGAFESGIVGQALGAPAAIVIGGAATLAVAGAFWSTVPALRNLDQFPESIDAAAVSGSDGVDQTELR